ncbi:hypothetical protein RI367_007355 [Sorochytrium milnesiophthora]
MTSIVKYADIAEPKDGESNLHALLCPVDRCRCVLLRAGKATVVRRPDIRLPDFAVNTDASPESTPHRQQESDLYFSVADMWTFENIGFSKDVQGRKYLACADCDAGPVGVHVVDPPTGREKEFLIKVERTRYQVAAA